jgi:hypothetical protein
MAESIKRTRWGKRKRRREAEILAKAESPETAELNGAVAAGALSGVALGAMAGPPGMIAGGLIGGAIGLAAGVVLEEAEAQRRSHDEDLDRDIGVYGGTIGEARQELPFEEEAKAEQEQDK